MLWFVPLSDTPTQTDQAPAWKSVRHFEIPGVQNSNNKIKLVLEAELATLPVIKSAQSSPQHHNFNSSNCQNLTVWTEFFPINVWKSVSQLKSFRYF